MYKESKKDTKSNLYSSIYNLSDNILTSGFPSDTELEVKRKVFMINCILIAGVAILSVFVFINVKNNLIFYAKIDALAAIALFFAILWLRKTKNYDLVSFFCVAFMQLLYLFLAISGGPHNTGYLWHYNLPLFTMFLLGKKWGTRFIVLNLTILAAFFFLPSLDFLMTDYVFAVKSRFFLSYVAVCIVAFILESVRELTQNRLVDKNIEHKKSIRELKLTEQRLKKIKGEQEIILNSMQELVVYLDKNLNVNWANKAAADLINLSRNELVGQKCFKLWHHASSACKNCPAELAKITHVPQESEVHGVNNRIWFVRAYPIEENGELEGIVEVIHDITIQKQAEEKMIAERKRAEFYLDLMGHDINNYNQGILSSLEMLKRNKSIETSQKRLLDMAVKQVQSSANLISSVKSLTEIQNEPFELESINLLNSLNEAIKLVYRSFPNKKIKINNNLKDKNLFILCNAFAVELFYNLFNNSVKYDRHDLIEIDVDVIDKGDMIRIEIKDHGPGISDSLKEIIFNRLERADNTVYGSGIGLTLVKNIAKSCGGNVWVEDRVKGNYTQGASFVVELKKA